MKTWRFVINARAKSPYHGQEIELSEAFNVICEDRYDKNKLHKLLDDSCLLYKVNFAKEQHPKGNNKGHLNFNIIEAVDYVRNFIFKYSTVRLDTKEYEECLFLCTRNLFYIKTIYTKYGYLTFFNAIDTVSKDDLANKLSSVGIDIKRGNNDCIYAIGNYFIKRNTLYKLTVEITETPTTVPYEIINK